MIKIKFCGAAEDVTGSCHLISTEHHKILLDCGEFQGSRAMEAMNAGDFGFDPAEIDCVVLSHAHIDHSGRLPLLVKRGFRGRIYCSDATAELVEVMLEDSGRIHEREAEWESKRNQRRGKPPVEPLFTYDDALDVLDYITPVLYDQLIEINDEMKIAFSDAGHILGSSIVELWITQTGRNGEEKTEKIVFSGDIGIVNRPILNDPTPIREAEYVIMESTYGDRLHKEKSGGGEELLEILVKTVKRGGTVYIPASAVGRTQELIYELNRIFDGDNEYKELLKDVMVYIDSSMAITATEIFQKNAQAFDEETRERLLSGDNPLDFENLKFVDTNEESRNLNADPKPKVIIAASAMCESGRIRHHLKHGLWNEKNSVVFVGHQSYGTLGREIQEGRKEVEVLGETVKVGAEIYSLDSFSGHADQIGLLKWLQQFEIKPRGIFLVHGEKKSKEAFAQYVKEQLGWNCTVIRGMSEFQLDETMDRRRTSESAEEEFADEEQLKNTRDGIARLKKDLGRILDDAQLAMNGQVSPERMVEINNLIMELEKAALNLSSTVTLEDREKEE